MDPPPMALILPAVPLPARVLTVPVSRLICRMRCVVVSATNTSVPLGPRVTPLGALNMALPTGPSRKPAAPVPARVVTVPAGEMERTRWFPASATSSEPSLSMARAEGELNCALMRTPFANPATPLPA